MDEPAAAPRSRSHGSRPTDDHLLTAARRVFVAEGYQAATMDAIAAVADCTKPTLYAHFPSKQAIYRASLDREVAALQQRLFAAYERGLTAPPRQQVRDAMAATFEYAEANEVGVRLIFATEGPDHLGALDRLTADIAARLASVFARVVPGSAGDPSDPALVAVASMTVGASAFGVRCALDRRPDERPEVLALCTAFVEQALVGFLGPG